MASDDSKKDSKFWLAVSDDQDDIRVSFHKNQGARRGIKPPAASGFWYNLTEDQQASRAEFFQQQKANMEKARARKPTDGSVRWPGITVTQITRRAKFFTDQKAALDHNRKQRAPGIGGTPPAKVASGFWADITVKQHRDREAFRKLQADNASKPKVPNRGTGFFTDITERQRLNRTAFVAEQAKTRSNDERVKREAAAKTKLKARAAVSSS